jgi:hypothetical protein
VKWQLSGAAVVLLSFSNQQTSSSNIINTSQVLRFEGKGFFIACDRIVYARFSHGNFLINLFRVLFFEGAQGVEVM